MGAEVQVCDFRGWRWEGLRHAENKEVGEAKAGREAESSKEGPWGNP